MNGDPSKVVDSAGTGPASSRPTRSRVGAAGAGWKKHAACRDSALEQFFEHRVVAGRPHAAAYRVAERYCAGCPVVSSCREDAEANDAVGLWGGQWRPASGGRPSHPVDLLPAPMRTGTAPAGRFGAG